jgi:acyl transferase domain-containing protein
MRKGNSVPTRRKAKAAPTRKRVKSPVIVDDIAIIGMQGRFPGARNVAELWENLKHGVESIMTFSEAEIQAAGIDANFLNVPGYVNRGCVLDDIDQFDAGFFGYSARDAETMDPQQRLFLECAWESLESAGCDPDTYPGMIGVFAGSDQSTYIYQIYSSVDLSAYGYGGMMSIANEKDYLTTQVSYKLNLRGPSLAIQTSCSTSLVAVCVACQNLAHGYCDVALAGGVGVGVPQKRGYWYQPGGILSPDGHCRPFDASAQGTVVGNGVAVVVLKRLSEAIADGDHIHAVIKGFALNNDGADKVGYTAPSVEGQARAIRMAQRMAGVEPETIGYVETHGTATALGDPVEVAALTRAFSDRTNAKQFCAIGSLKSNVGHLSSAAGITGLLKGVLVVENGQIPKSLHYENPNPQIDFQKSPFYVASELRDWPRNGHPRRAGVSSFGVGGTNAHIVLEQAPTFASGADAPEKQILVLSARSEAALEKMTDNLVNFLDHSSDDLADVAFTLQAGRKRFPYRRAVIFDRNDRQTLTAALRKRDPERVLTKHIDMRDRSVVFMFSGQGTQYVDMGLELYETEKTFRDCVDECSEILKSEMGLDLRRILYPRSRTKDADAKLKQTAITQPALFTIEYSLARLWMKWGLTPKAMVGHSIGEYVAACLAGVMDLPAALSVVAMRGRLMDSMPGGSMLAVPLSEGMLQPLLNSTISLAAVNAPALCVLSGPVMEIDALEQQLITQGLPCRRLHTSHAFHSSMMDPVITQFVTRISLLDLKSPQIPYLSNVTGAWITPELATSPHYWGAHLRHTVRFGDNLRELMVFPDLALLEIGPGQTLSLLAQQQGTLANTQLFVSSLRSPQETGSDSAFLRNAICKLWIGGARIDWRTFHDGEKRHIVSLPTYPFERQRFWLGPLDLNCEAEAKPAVPGATVVETAPTVSIATPAHPVKVQTDLADWFFVPNWKRAVSPISNNGSANKTGVWLVFQDSGSLGEELVQHLRNAGHRVNAVVHGDRFDHSDGKYQIRIGEKSDYGELIKTLRARGDLPTQILHLWSTDNPLEQESPIQAFSEAQDRSFFSLILLAQAWAKSGGSAQVNIGVVSECLQSVLGNEHLRSAEATVLGACKVISQEYPNLRCRLIDIAKPQSRLPELLVNEMSSEKFDAVVAYRNESRWVQSFEPIRLTKGNQKPALLRDGGVYLITGGLGNIGLLLAEAIAAHVKAKFVLTGRSLFPERNLWNTHVSSHPLDATSLRIKRLKAMEQSGAEIMVAQADATDPDQMKAVVDAAREKWGRICGVIHGAANLSPDAFAPVREVNRRNSVSHFAPKAHGLLILEQLLHDEPPDFVVLLSSISALLGGLGLTAYAASNAYLDVEAQRLNQNGASSTSWITINWDAWDFPPQAKGDAISGAQGQEAFRRIITAALTHVVVAATPLGPRLDKWVNLETLATGQPTEIIPKTGDAALTLNQGTPVHGRPDLSTQYVAPRSETEKTITQVWETLLGVQPIGIYDKFFELGGHSLLAIQLLSRLREIFELDLPVQRLFEAPSVAQLSESIDRDRASAPPVETVAVDDADNLSEMLRLVEGLSEAELDALLSEAEGV